MLLKDRGGLYNYVRPFTGTAAEYEKRYDGAMEITPADDEDMKDSNSKNGLKKSCTPELYQRSQFSEEEIEKLSPVLVHGNERETAGLRPGRFKRLWAHAKRHWILYTIGNIIFLAVILILIFLVIIPAVVRSIVNSNALPIYSAGLTSPSPDHIDVTLHSSLKVPSGISARMDAQTLGLYISKDTKSPYLEVALPEYHLKGTTNVTIINQTCSILNQTEFTEFISNALNSRNVTMYVRSKTTIHLGALKTKVNINKALVIPGLNKLKGFAVSSLELNNQDLVSNVIIPNPSPLTVDLGNLTQNVYSGSTNLGTGVIQNAVIRPFYNNTYPLVLSVDISTALQNLSQLLSSQAGVLATGQISLTTNNNETVYDGQHIDYFEKPLQALRLPIDLDLSTVLSTLSVNLSGAGNGTDTGGAAGLSGLLGDGSILSEGLQSLLQGISDQAGPELGAILSGIL